MEGSFALVPDETAPSFPLSSPTQPQPYSIISARRATENSQAAHEHRCRCRRLKKSACAAPFCRPPSARCPAPFRRFDDILSCGRQSGRHDSRQPALSSLPRKPPPDETDDILSLSYAAFATDEPADRRHGATVSSSDRRHGQATLASCTGWTATFEDRRHETASAVEIEQ